MAGHLLVGEEGSHLGARREVAAADGVAEIAAEPHPQLAGGLAAGAVGHPAGEAEAAGGGQALLDEPFRLRAHRQGGEVAPRLRHHRVEILEVVQAAGDAMDGGAGREVREDAADEGLVDVGGAVLLGGEGAALAAGIEEEAGGREPSPGGEEVLVVDAEHQHPAGIQPPVEAAEPGAEGRLGEMGEERGDEDGVEDLRALEARRVGLRDEAVDAEGRLLEADAALIDVRHPEALGRDVEHGVAGHPAVAAGEVEELERPGRIVEAGEAPAQQRRQRRPDAAAGIEIEDQRLAAVLAAQIQVLDQHLVLGVDGEARRGARAGREAEGGEEGVRLGGVVGERHQVVGSSVLAGAAVGHCTAAARAMARIESRAKRFCRRRANGLPKEARGWFGREKARMSYQTVPSS